MLKQELLNTWKSDRKFDDKLIKAFLQVPREEFVLDEFKQYAYEDSPLPIYADQTISQPTTVMMMINWLNLQKDDTVLEIGTGSGYNAALMSKLCKKVITLEIVEDLCEFAKKNLKKVSIENVEVICCDGSKGYPKYAPYDKMIVTAAAKEIPKLLLYQLKDGGILLCPVGEFSQEMIKVTKKGDKFDEENLGHFMFMPLKS